MFKRVGHILLIVALLAATGSHWAILQSVAWTTMLADNLQTLSFKDAVIKTFDGHHPCSLCKQISQGKNSEKKTDLSLDLKKFDFCYDSVGFVFISPEHFWVAGSVQPSLRLLSQSPPTPPPRLA